MLSQHFGDCFSLSKCSLLQAIKSFSFMWFCIILGCFFFVCFVCLFRLTFSFCDFFYFFIYLFFGLFYLLFHFLKPSYLIIVVITHSLLRQLVNRESIVDNVWSLLVVVESIINFVWGIPVSLEEFVRNNLLMFISSVIANCSVMFCFVEPSANSGLTKIKFTLRPCFFLKYW